MYTEKNMWLVQAEDRVEDTSIDDVEHRRRFSYPMKRHSKASVPPHRRSLQKLGLMVRSRSQFPARISIWNATSIWISHSQRQSSPTNPELRIQDGSGECKQ